MTEGTPGGEIAGRVLRPGGSPVAEAAVMIVGSPEPHPDIAALTGGDGGFSFRALSPGEYTLMANAPGAQPMTRRVRVLPGAVATLDFTIPGG